jgi:hypothetical protein
VILRVAQRKLRVVSDTELNRPIRAVHSQTR